MYKKICFQSNDEPSTILEEVDNIQWLGKVAVITTKSGKELSLNLFGDRLQITWREKPRYEKYIMLDLAPFITNIIKQMLNDGDKFV